MRALRYMDPELRGGAIVGARVVVHPDREVVLPEIEPARMPVMVAIVVQEGLQKIKFGP
jgi:hypothetical protein